MTCKWNVIFGTGALTRSALWALILIQGACAVQSEGDPGPSPMHEAGVPATAQPAVSGVAFQPAPVSNVAASGAEAAQPAPDSPVSPPPPATQPPSPAPPPCTAAAFRQFDFWLGDWQVATPDGRQAGQNRIVTAEQDCVLVERWQGVQGGTGRSYNFYDTAGKLWRQIWLSPGIIIDIAGEFGGNPGAMRLVGTIVYAANGASRPFRGTWTPLADGRVRQFFEEERDGKWQTWFEGIYTRDDNNLAAI